MFGSGKVTGCVLAEKPSISIEHIRLPDSSRFSNHGVYTAAITDVQLSNGLWVRSFNGTTSIITVPDHASITDIFDSGGTILTWVNPASDGELNLGSILYKDNTTNGFYWVVKGEADSKVKLGFLQRFSTQAGLWDTTATEITINTWTMIAVTYDNGLEANNPIVYINTIAKTVGDGLTEVVIPIGTRASDIGIDLIVGNRSDVATTFDGYIALPKIFNYALTPAQIRAIYSAERHWFGV